MLRKDNFFNSKILLFGEYSLMVDSMALSVPFDLFNGRLKFNNQEIGKSKYIDGELKTLCNYLKIIDKKNDLHYSLNLNAFEFDISQGLIFQSTIPQGFGLGSSGALTASIFDRYRTNLHNPNEILELRNVFAKIESHFHGASSGIDPLISYYNKPILLNGIDNIKYTNIPSYNTGKGGMFLLNTGRARRTEPLVDLFLEKCKSSKFQEECKNTLLPVTNNCIKSFLDNRISDLGNNFKKLSSFQYSNFSPMIPRLFKESWHDGIANDDYYLKLCGAGGGGFILGFTTDFKKVEQSLSRYELRPIYSF